MVTSIGVFVIETSFGILLWGIKAAHFSCYMIKFYLVIISLEENKKRKNPSNNFLSASAVTLEEVIE